MIKLYLSMHFSVNLDPGLLVQYFQSDSLKCYIRKGIHIFRFQINFKSLTNLTRNNKLKDTILTTHNTNSKQTTKYKHLILCNVQKRLQHTGRKKGKIKKIYYRLFATTLSKTRSNECLSGNGSTIASYPTDPRIELCYSD